LQSVFIHIKDSTTGNVTLTQAARVHNNNNPTGTLKSALANDVFRLVVKGNGRSDETVIVQNVNAENGIDKFDAEKLFINDPDYAISDPNLSEIYTIVSGKRIVIQEVKPISIETWFPLGIRVGLAGNYNFVANFNESLLTNDVYLLDKKSNPRVLQNLYTNPGYSFNSGIVNDTTASRFMLIFSPKGMVPDTSPLATPTLTLEKAIVYGLKNDIYIKNNIPGSDIHIFNMDGKLLRSERLYSEAETIHTGFEDGCYIVKLTNASNVITKKIVLIK
jgi:hypothetical protein